ncbi:unnamed protein product [Ilex paraguariensis]|uniref:Uncharacterized protein n=1 Tax=Ilex paraguariensis TaxID=185542 RepID=A0ABC8SQY4_9AQUA
MNPNQIHKHIPPKPLDIIKNFASLFKNNSNFGSFLELSNPFAMHSNLSGNLPGDERTQFMPPTLILNPQTSLNIQIPANSQNPLTESDFVIPHISSNIQSLQVLIVLSNV